MVDPPLSSPFWQRLMLLAATLWFSWLAMMLVHEAGHVAAAWLTGGVVRHVVWHPLVLSRTDVQPNPHPRIEVWAGPLFGGWGPLLACFTFSQRGKYSPLWAFTGFCLLANGAYLGVGAFDPAGDVKQLLVLGTPWWVLVIVGAAMAGSGLLVWERISPAFGFGTAPLAVSRTNAYAMLVLALLLTTLGLLLDLR